MTQGARILGDVLIEQSSATFSANQFSDINLTFGAGTSYCIVDSSNLYSSGFTSTNNGNGANNIIIQNSGTGADGYAYFKYGAGTSTRSLGFNFTDATKGFKFDGSIILPNSHGIKLTDSKSAERIIAILASNDNLTLGTNTGTYTYIQGNNLGLNSAGGTQVRVSDGFIAPFSDNTKMLGTSALRWQHSYINNAHFFPLSSVLPSANGEVMLELTNDTTLNFKVKGNDGMVRSATLTLA